MPRVLCIVPEGVEELELVAPVDVLRRAGVTVVLASLDASTRVTGRNGIVLLCDRPVAADEPLADALFLPGGPGVARLRASPLVRELVLRHHAAGRLLAALCAAPAVLHDAGLLHGRRHTAHPSVAAELPELLPEERVVLDEPFLIGRGAGVALDFGLAMVARLTSPATAAGIADAIRA